MRRYCVYCARVAHRCECAKPDSPLNQFLARANLNYTPAYRETSYKRGVPPQIKRRERAVMRRRYDEWLAVLVERYGARCQHCGAEESLVLDHIVSIARGGLSELENLQILCAACNTAKGKLVYDCR